MPPPPPPPPTSSSSSSLLLPRRTIADFKYPRRNTRNRPGRYIMPLFTSRINHAIPRILNGRPGKEVVGKTERARSGAALRVKLLGVSDRLAGPINFRFNLSPIRATMRRSNVFFNKFHAELSLNLASRPICILTGEYEARLEMVIDFDFSTRNILKKITFRLYRFSP